MFVRHTFGHKHSCNRSYVKQLVISQAQVCSNSKEADHAVSLLATDSKAKENKDPSQALSTEMF